MAVVASVVYFRKITEIVETNKDMSDMFWGVAKQTGYAAGGAVAGGLFAGPVGAFMGSVAGAFIGLQHAGSYKPLHEVLRDMNQHEQEELIERIQQLIGATSIEALVDYVRSEANRAILLQTIGSQMLKR